MISNQPKKFKAFNLDTSNQGIAFIFLVFNNLIMLELLTLLVLLRVRIHANLIYKLKAPLDVWYLLRSLDLDGSGKFNLDFVTFCKLLNRDEKTVYRLLHQAKKLGLIWTYSVNKGILHGFYKSLSRVCLENEISNWGTVTQIAPIDIRVQAKKSASAATIAQRQESSKRALAACFKQKDRKIAIARSIEGCLDTQNSVYSHKTVRGEKSPILGIDRHYIYGSKSLLIFGCNQHSTAKILSCCEKTLQRNLSSYNKRQIAIAKKEYQKIAMMIDKGMIGLHQKLYISQDVHLTRLDDDLYQLREKIPGSEAFKVSKVSRGNFFIGLFDKWYCAFTNFYALEDLPKLDSMKRSRSKYKSLRKRAKSKYKCPENHSTEGGGLHTGRAS